MEAAGVEFQVFQPGAKVHPCMACYHCLNTGSLRCVQTDDMVNDIIAACIERTASCWQLRCITAVFPAI